jgi:hypothetical protein
MNSRAGYEVDLRLKDTPHMGSQGCETILRLIGFGANVVFVASMRNHTVGVLPTMQLMDFLSRCRARGYQPATAADVREGMYDFDQTVDEPNPSLSGVEIIFDGWKLEIRVGQHCFGSAEGPLIGEFFHRSWVRATFDLGHKRAA